MRRSRKSNRRTAMRVGVAGASLLLFLSAGRASELVFQFVNPSFGGNPLNSTHLLGIANAINDYDDPEAKNGATNLVEDRSSRLDLSPEAQFARQLQGRLYSGLANQIVEAIFGANPQEQGEFQFGATTISFVRGLETVDIVISDSTTGQVTEIAVPILTMP